jgi:CubicO group peptidase (beta-lactamase class C family)
MKPLLFIILLFGITTAFAQDHTLNQKNLEKIKSAKLNLALYDNLRILPIREIINMKIASIHFQDAYAHVFDSIASKYCGVTTIDASHIETTEGFNALHDQLKLYNQLFFSFTADTKFSPSLISFIRDMAGLNNVVLRLSGKEKNLQQLQLLKIPLLYNKENNSESAALAAQAIFGGVAVSGIQKIRLGYSVPESVDMNSDKLNRIDSLIKTGIATHAAPAVVVLLVKDGQVIFYKAYGKHTYDGEARTKIDDIFDMASVTKVTATTPAIMQLYEKKEIGLDSAISKYVALVRDIPDKRDVKIKEALLHEAGFTPYIKFYEQLKPGDTSRDSSARYPTKVADGYYLRANYFNEVMWPVTLKSKSETRGKYVYSDLSMYMMKEVVEEVTHQKLNDFVSTAFYNPLGMQSTGFLPRNRFNRSRIVPTTENDNWFRNMLVQGYVNDPGAAMAGGVEGHAGLFANANDLAIFYQMLLNQGAYGGHTYFEPSTVKLFTSRQSKVSLRGYGYDRISANQKPGDLRSEQAFGHSGYTGTYVWVDPKYNLIYIFLSNRVYPDDGKTFGPSKINLRPAVLDMFYEALAN